MSISQRVLDAFSIKGEVGTSSDGIFHGVIVGEYILIPDHAPGEAEWKGALMESLASEKESHESYNVSVALRTVEGRFDFERWMAFSHPSDVSTSPEHWMDLLNAANGFSTALKDKPQPHFLLERSGSSPPAVADRVAWGEVEITVDESLADLCMQLRKLQRSVNIPCQLIHGDMTGTAVFCKSSFPTIFNVIPFWRPAAYSRAIIIADALVKGLKKQEFILNAGFHTMTHLQLLLRALQFRIVERSELFRTAGPVSRSLANIYESALREVKSLMLMVSSHSALESWAKYARTGGLHALSAAISFSEQAIYCADPEHLDWAIAHHNLSDLLRLRSEVFETDASTREKDLDQAVYCAKVAVDCGGDHLDQFLLHHSNALLARYESSANDTDLNFSLTQIEEGIKIHRTKRKSSGAEIAPLYSTLACVHKAIFERYGRVQNIDAAIVAAHDSVGALRSDQKESSHEDAAKADPDYPAYQNQLGNALSRRFERTGALVDADASIVALKVATSIDHNRQAAFFTNLGDALRDRFERTGQTEDIDEAVQACKKALQLTPGAKHSRRGLRLHNAGCALQRQFEAGTQLNKAQRLRIIDEAIKLKEEAYDLLKGGTGATCSLVSALSARSDMPSYEKDLDRAITLLQVLNTINDKNSPNYAGYLNIVGNAFKKRYDRDGSHDDLMRAIEAYKKAHGTKTASALERIIAAHNCSTLLYFGKQDVHEADKILRSGVHLMPQCCPQSIDRTDQQFFLSALYGLSRSAAAVCLEAGGSNAPAEALDLLETGRGIISTMQLRTRADLTDLAVAHPEKADRFTALRNEIDGSSFRSDRLSGSIQGENMALQSHRVKCRHSVVEEFEDLIAEIRDLEGFRTFLSGPRKSDLLTVSQAGSIVVLNVADVRCDAIIINQGEITHLPLPELSAKDAEQKAQAFLESIRADNDANRRQTIRTMNEVLEWLWDSAIKQILKALGVSTPHEAEKGAWPRVWWIPTGVLSRFPIHAAGYHGQRASKGNVLDCVISSYAPSVKALVSANDQIKRTDKEFEDAASLRRRVALVAAPEPPGRPALTFAKDEIEIIKKYMVYHEIDTIDEKAGKLDVIRLLKWCYVIHLACHGDSLMDPSASRIVLDDWKTNSLTVRDISEMQLHSAGLMYISACHVMHVEMITLQDESIHLVGACLLAGFPRVIGTLWQVNDKRSSNLSKDFYSKLVDNQGTNLHMDHVAAAFHDSVRSLRDATTREEGVKKVFPPDPMIWSSYVHVGL